MQQIPTKDDIADIQDDNKNNHDDNIVVNENSMKVALNPTMNYLMIKSKQLYIYLISYYYINYIIFLKSKGTNITNVVRPKLK